MCGRRSDGRRGARRGRAGAGCGRRGGGEDEGAAGAAGSVGVPESADVVRARLEAAFLERSARLPSYQHVRAVHLWDGDLPKTSTLKVKRARVKAEIDARLSRGARDTARRPARGAQRRRQALRRAVPPALLTRAAAARRRRCLLARHGTPENEITPDAQDACEIDLAVDSLMRVEIAAFLESRFGVHLSDDQQLALKTVGDILDKVERGGGGGARRAASPRRESSPPRLSRTGSASFRQADWDATPGRADGAPIPVPRPALALHSSARGDVFDGRSYVRALRRGRRTRNLPTDRLHHRGESREPPRLGRGHPGGGPRGRRLRVVGAKDYFFNTALSAWFFGRLLHAIPFDRNENFVEGLRLCRGPSRRDDSLLIFPEGTRTTNGDLQPFRLAWGVLARELDVPIVPAFIDGAYDALPKGNALPRSAKIKVHFGEPILPDSAGAGDGAANYEAYKRIVEATRAAIDAMRRASA